MRMVGINNLLARGGPGAIDVDPSNGGYYGGAAV
jgi:hypothetical protein